MAEATPSIVTNKKEKDPRRVEAGKRLAAISKQAKERKKKERESRLLSREWRWSATHGLSHHHQVGLC